MHENEMIIPPENETVDGAEAKETTAELAEAERAENEAAVSPADVKAEKGKRSVKEAFANYFTATRISYIAVFTALSFIFRLPWFEFYIIPAVPFLKIDFSGVFALIAGLALGPIAGVVVSVVKELLYALCFTQTIGVGELANILIMLPYLLIPTIIYKKHKGIKTVLISLAAACVCQVIWSVPVNYLLTFPFYLNLYAGSPWKSGMKFYLGVWYWAVLFNFVKTVLLTAAVLLLYKPLSRLIKLTGEKFAKRKKKNVE